MTWYAVKNDFDRRIAETMSADGFEARSSWDRRTGVIQCGNPGHGSWNFEVHVNLDFNGAAAVEVRSMYDTLRRGKLIDIETEEVVPQRKFSFRAGDTAGMGEFLRELGKETKRWAAKFAVQEENEARGHIEEHLRELIERDPANAAEIIAGILNRHLAPYEIEALQETVMEANRGAPVP